MPYDHLVFSREEPVPNRHKKRANFIPFKPENPREYGQKLLSSLQSNLQPLKDEIRGFDERILFKIQLRDGSQAPQLSEIPGVEFISQEDKTIILAFADQVGLNNFQSRLSSLARDGEATRADILYALESFDHWTPKDRRGPALTKKGIPKTADVILDIELWPLERADQRSNLLTMFTQELQNRGIRKLDELNLPSLLMLRVNCSEDNLESFILHHRDVRQVDLPPSSSLEIEILRSDISSFPAIPPPPEDAAKVVVLDSGITSGHPLLGQAIGDAQGFLEPLKEAFDKEPQWHGTHVSGLALYGDIESCARKGEFVPTLRLFSGKVFDDGYDNTNGFVEKAVDSAVRYFKFNYSCKVFNFSYGDSNKIYDGRRLRGLAYTLDQLARELDVLFIVPTGNLTTVELPDDPISEYPNYLLETESRLLDPAPALNVLTIGGIARHTTTHHATRHKSSIETIPIAQESQPFPLTRSGHSIFGAIKPDLVDFAGNVALTRNGKQKIFNGLGVLTTTGGFSTGHPLAEDVGTSFAAPQIAHRVARLTKEVPKASANLLRAIIATHARWPKSSVDLLNPDDNADGKAKLLRLVGYGQIDDESLYKSSEHKVTLFSEDTIGNDKCQFYELPSPSSFWSSGNRQREISIALAYSPDTRTTRLDYRMSKLWFTLVKAPSLEEVQHAFRPGHSKDETISEISNNRWISSTDRKNSSLQSSRWVFKRPLQSGEKLFIVITRQDAKWGDTSDLLEPYSLAVVFSDRENIQANLHSEIKVQLDARIQSRARVRV